MRLKQSKEAVRAAVLQDLRRGKLSRVQIAQKHRLHPTTVCNYERAQDTSRPYCIQPRVQNRPKRTALAEEQVGEVVNSYLIKICKAVATALVRSPA